MSGSCAHVPVVGHRTQKPRSSLNPKPEQFAQLDQPKFVKSSQVDLVLNTKLAQFEQLDEMLVEWGTDVAKTRDLYKYARFRVS